MSQSERSPAVTSTSAPEQINNTVLTVALCAQIKNNTVEEVKTHRSLCFLPYLLKCATQPVNSCIIGSLALKKAFWSKNTQNVLEGEATYFPHMKEKLNKQAVKGTSNLTYIYYLYVYISLL